MIAFEGMLVPPADAAGIKVPADPESFNDKLFPHFAVFRNVQLGSPMPSPTSHWHNAKVIASIPDDKIMTVTFKELEALGIEVGFPIP